MINTIAITLILGQLAHASISVTVPNALVSLFEKTEEFHETYRVAAGTQIQVDNVNGDIKISKWTEDYVDVYAKKKTNHGEGELAKADIEVVVDDMMKISTKYLEKNVRVSVNYAIRVPEGVVVQEVKTSNGEIELNRTQGDAEVMTSNGEIDLNDVKGTVSARTSNGEIDIRGTTAVLEAHTSNGEVYVEIHSIPEDGTSISSSNGSIHVYISNDLNADLRAATSMGTVSMKGVTLRSRLNAGSEVSTLLVGEIGEGGRLIDVSTSNGEIRLHGLGK